MRNFIILSLFFLFLVSCNTSEKILYLQDVETGEAQKITPEQAIKIQPKDMMSIVVSSKDPDLAAMFNLPINSYRAGTDLPNYNNYLQGYVVDNNGDINFPVIGKIHAAGLSRWQLQEKIKAELKSRDMLKDAIVSVDFMNFKVSILGEVNKPGTYTIEGEKVTVLEALAMAKDLTIYGLRDEVYVIREQNNQRDTYKLDLRSKDIFESPAYYLKQNDIVYVKPNKVRAGQSTLNQNSLKSVSLWVSIASLLCSVGVMIANILDD